MKRLIAILVMLIVGAAVLGCAGENTERREAIRMRTITDSAGNEVTLPEKPQRIVSLTLGTDELLMDLVPAERIVGLTHLSNDAGISHVSERSGAVKNKIKGNSAEAIFELQPDLVLIADWWALNILQTLRDMGIPVYVYKTPYNVNDVEKMIAEVAEAVGESGKGEMLRQAYHERVKQLRLRRGSTGRRSAVTLSGHGGTNFGAKGSMYDDMCEYAGIENCLKDLPANGQATLSKEYIIEKNPDVILIPAWTMQGMNQVASREELLADSSLQTVNAIREKRIYPISGKAIYCVSHYVAQEIEVLAAAVYPEYFGQGGRE